MGQKSGPAKEPAELGVKDIRRATRRHFSAEDNICIALEGLRGEDSIAALCRREGIGENLYCRWSKDFLEAGKKRLAGDTTRAAPAPGSRTGRGYRATMGRVTSPVTWRSGSGVDTWVASAGRHSIPRPRARSSGGIRHPRTAFCSRTTTYPATSRPRSAPSSITTTTTANTRLSIARPRPASISVAAILSCCKGRGSNDRPSRCGD
jgi:hypothetical protein